MTRHATLPDRGGSIAFSPGIEPTAPERAIPGGCRGPNTAKLGRQKKRLRAFPCVTLLPGLGCLANVLPPANRPGCHSVLVGSRAALKNGGRVDIDAGTVAGSRAKGRSVE